MDQLAHLPRGAAPARNFVAKQSSSCYNENHKIIGRSAPGPWAPGKNAAGPETAAAGSGIVLMRNRQQLQYMLAFGVDLLSLAISTVLV
ncbi:MAG: hypothetical protein PUF76_04925, partial [bacterium]|nr:hypothetical protein [bacterium]